MAMHDHDDHDDHDDYYDHVDHDNHNNYDDQKGSVGPWQALGDWCDNTSCTSPLCLPGGNINIQRIIFQYPKVIRVS